MRFGRLSRAWWAVGLAAVFLAAHLAFLPPTLEDVDSTNFALGIRDFDPASHRPHPPGYPVFIALGKLARVVLPSDVAALAVVGAVFGSLAVFPLLALFRSIEITADRPDPYRCWQAPMATLLVVTCPLFWFTALRPMSDIPGLTAVLVAQASLVAALVRQQVSRNATPRDIATSGRLIVLGALAAGIALGIRSQAVWLTMPVLALVLLHRVGRGAAGALLGALMTLSIGIAAWAVPLVIASGGWSRYRAALAAQAAEDLAGVDMLLRNPSARRLAVGLLQSFIYPWASTPLGLVVFGLALLGFVVLLWRAPMAALVVSVLAGPYAIFHLVFQETLTTRYALPLMPVLGYLAIRGASVLGRRAAPVVVAIVVVWGMVLTVPAARAYARTASPTFAALEKLRQAMASGSSATLGLHEAFARSVQTARVEGLRVLAAPPMREWLELASYWRNGHREPVWFLADPARTDLELIDPLSRSLRAEHIWTFPRLRFMSGVRPDIVDLVRIDSPPAWFCEEGWHLTPETLNMSERQVRQDAVAYVRPRAEPALLVIGGQSLADKATLLTVAIDGRLIDRWSLPAGGSFFRRTMLPAGAIAGNSSLPRLVVTYGSAEGTSQPVRVRLTQFAVQSPSDVFAIQHAGWHEIEYSREQQRRWRWTSDHAVTFVNSGGRDLLLTISGESPLRYFDAPSAVVIRAGDLILARETATADFDWRVKVPAAALEASDGMLFVETNQTFVPGDRSGSPDRRRLGLRIFRFEVTEQGR